MVYKTPRTAFIYSEQLEKYSYPPDFPLVVQRAKKTYVSWSILRFRQQLRLSSKRYLLSMALEDYVKITARNNSTTLTRSTETGFPDFSNTMLHSTDP
jgi:hypothetical protein